MRGQNCRLVPEKTSGAKSRQIERDYYRVNLSRKCLKRGASDQGFYVARNNLSEAQVRVAVGC